MEARLSRKQSAGVNTGKYEKYIEPGLVRLALLVPYNWRCDISPWDTPDEVAAKVKTALSEALIEDNYADRAQILGPFESFEDKTTEAGKATLGFGREIFTSKEIVGGAFTYIEGGLDYHCKVMKFKGLIRQYKIVWIDEKGNVGAVKTYESLTGVLNGIQGFELAVFHPEKWRLPGKDTPPKYGFTYSLKNSDEWDDHLFVIGTDEDMLSYLEPYAVQDVELIPKGFLAQVATFTAMLGGVSVPSEVPAMVAPANFLVKNKNTNLPIAVDSATIDAEGRVALTLDETDPNYLAAAKCTVQLADVSDLDANDLKYYASNVIEFTMD